MKHLLFFLVTLASLVAFSQNEFPEKPVPAKLVNDFADVLSSKEEITLEEKLLNFFTQSSTQISLVTVTSIHDYEVNDYATRLAEKWGIGGAKHDNGVLVLFKPKTKAKRGQVYIAVGYGLEGAIPDALANRIADNVMIPFFKQSKTYEGLAAGLDAVILAAKGEYTEVQQVGKKSKPLSVIEIVFIGLFFVFIIFAVTRRRRHHSLSSTGKALTAATLIDILTSTRRSRAGSFKDFTGGSGSFGGGGFSSFGGFGGGSFGGGGAGGSW